MSQAAVKQAVAKIFSDNTFRKAFEKNPEAALTKSGLSLTQDEISALAKLKPSDLKVNVKTGPGTKSAVEVGVTAIKSFKPGPAAAKGKVIR